MLQLHSTAAIREVYQFYISLEPKPFCNRITKNSISDWFHAKTLGLNVGLNLPDMYIIEVQLSDVVDLVFYFFLVVFFCCLVFTEVIIPLRPFCELGVVAGDTCL